MASVNVTSIEVLNPVANFTDPLSFVITFECQAPLTDGALPYVEMMPVVAGSRWRWLFSSKLWSMHFLPAQTWSGKWSTLDLQQTRQRTRSSTTSSSAPCRSACRASL